MKFITRHIQQNFSRHNWKPKSPFTYWKGFSTWRVPILYYLPLAKPRKQWKKASLANNTVSTSLCTTRIEIKRLNIRVRIFTTTTTKTYVLCTGYNKRDFKPFLNIEYGLLILFLDFYYLITPVPLGLTQQPNDSGLTTSQKDPEQATAHEVTTPKMHARNFPVCP